eukprot:CAMPEP_0204355888 /NCGR_PEP_ID=MMETSP0469-20131031/34510_1 /ASSEMBLY_ACC=CAM_ASM_000384 /TAXON_ID=2969 /ORGANISM="Oxyrrhis marina" /LENGTH=46 /DNA_ID= /DNA_START= /DNA_END= /DNA_ORIENTATION=
MTTLIADTPPSPGGLAAQRAPQGTKPPTGPEGSSPASNTQARREKW